MSLLAQYTHDIGLNDVCDSARIEAQVMENAKAADIILSEAELTMIRSEVEALEISL